MTVADASVPDSSDALLVSWRCRNDGESVVPLVLTLLVAIALQAVLPSRFTFHPRWVLPLLSTSILVAVALFHGRIGSSGWRIDEYSPKVRAVTITLIVVITVANTISAVRLVVGILAGSDNGHADQLLLSGAAIWITNVVVFALWYWEFDRTSPGHRAEGTGAQAPDMVFPQMMNADDLNAPGWFPTFTDYLYLSFTNGAAFSPTDVMPYARWAKVAMMGQSSVSLCLVALVVARSVNILA